jgi:hypothetical protein
LSQSKRVGRGSDQKKRATSHASSRIFLTLESGESTKSRSSKNDGEHCNHTFRAWAPWCPTVPSVGRPQVALAVNSWGRVARETTRLGLIG